MLIRGCLEDARAKGIEYDPLCNCRITVYDIENVSKNQDLDFNHGDIFLNRIRFTDSVLDLGGPEPTAEIQNY